MLDRSLNCEVIYGIKNIIHNILDGRAKYSDLLLFCLRYRDFVTGEAKEMVEECIECCRYPDHRTLIKILSKY